MMRLPFEMEVKDLFGMSPNVGIVFRGTVRKGTINLGDKAEYTEDDGTKISVVVTKIMEMETKKIFWIFGFQQVGKKIPSAAQGQFVSVMVADFFDIGKQCPYFPPICRTHPLFTKMSKTKTLRSLSGS